MSGQATCRWGRRHRQPADEKVTGDFPEWGKKRGVAWRGKEAKDGTETDGFYGSETPFPNRRLSLNLAQHFLFLNLFFSLPLPLFFSSSIQPTQPSPHCQERAIASLLSRLFIATECSPSSLFSAGIFAPPHTLNFDRCPSGSLYSPKPSPSRLESTSIVGFSQSWTPSFASPRPCAPS